MTVVPPDLWNSEKLNNSLRDVDHAIDAQHPTILIVVDPYFLMPRSHLRPVADAAGTSIPAV